MTDLFPPEALAPAPIETALTIPSAWYTDPRVLAFERDAVFARTWQFVGHTSRLENAGDYLTATVAENPVVVIRDREGGLRAFYNVCRHRGGPLATDDHGCARMLQCQYHGWTYRLDGSLRGVPRFGHSELFDKRDFGLVPVEVNVAMGLVFVRLEPGGPSLGEALDGIEARIAPMNLASLRFHTRVEYRVACDWKVYVDNYLEGYHLPLVHPELCDVLDAAAYRTETFPHYNLQHSPLREGEANVYGGAEDAAFYYWLFPTTMLNILPGRLQTNTVLPDGPGRCRVLFDYHYDDPEAGRVADDLAFSDRVQAEDIAICEHVQRGLASRGYDQGRFSPAQEVGVHHFQELLKGCYREALED
ncbi:MAG: aromatic ring-hydroxylating dioxygenase subunit alpha [Bacteroidota bacterium]